MTGSAQAEDAEDEDAEDEEALGNESGPEPAASSEPARAESAAPAANRHTEEEDRLLRQVTEVIQQAQQDTTSRMQQLLQGQQLQMQQLQGMQVHDISIFAPGDALIDPAASLDEPPQSRTPGWACTSCKLKRSL